MFVYYGTTVFTIRCTYTFHDISTSPHIGARVGSVAGSLEGRIRKFFFLIIQIKRVSSVSDPYSFFPDPDPEVEAGGQYGSGYGSGSNPDPGL